MEIGAVVFDAYGTLFDIDALAPHCERLWPGYGSTLVNLWRTKQLQYSWLRSLMSSYADFDAVTTDALIHACKTYGLPCDAGRVQTLLGAFHSLQTFPEVPAVLKALRGRRRAILSNGSPTTLETTVRNSGLQSEIDLILSVDSVKVYKPDPRVYRLAVDALALDKERIAFVSSNSWDACGAKRFGFRVFWVNRAGGPLDELGIEPDRDLSNLEELPRLL